MKYKKNGHIHNGTPHHHCKACGRQFVQCSDQYLIGAEQRAMIERLLLERISVVRRNRHLFATCEHLTAPCSMLFVTHR